MRATFVNLCQDISTPLIDCYNLMDDIPEKENLFLCLSFVPYDIPLRGGRGGFHFATYAKSTS
jgi:hypothetical protein